MIFNFKRFRLGSICKKYGIENYTINNGLVDVDGDVDLNSRRLDKLPLTFGMVTGNFYCSYNQLKTLEGSPREVGSDFYCYNNQLRSLEGCPTEVGGDFNCNNNQLTSLEGSPNKVGGYFYCYNNQLTTLEGSPSKVGGDFYCSSNLLSSLEGSPREVGGDFYCRFNKLRTLKGISERIDGYLYLDGNPINNIGILFKNDKQFIELLNDYNFIYNDKIIKARFEQACLEAGITMPKEIEGYDIT
jgi:hypothetical protein